MTGNELIVEEIIKRIQPPKLTLRIAASLISAIEEESCRKGLNVVISVCNPYGNIIAVHVMDDAYLVSFDVSMKKAYTAVALKAPTIEIGRQAGPGQPLYGVNHLENGKIIIIGGGVPLYYNDSIIGGLGISGGTGEQDNDLAVYGASLLPQILSA